MGHHDRETIKMVQRVKKLRGQMDAIERSLTSDGDCGDQLMLLAAVRGGVNALMGEVLETHIRFHLTDGIEGADCAGAGRGPDRPGAGLPEVAGPHFGFDATCKDAGRL